MKPGDAEHPQLDAEQMRRLMGGALPLGALPVWTVTVKESSRCYNRATESWETVERPCVLHLTVDVRRLVAQVGRRAIANKTRKATAQGGAVVFKMLWQGERPASWPERGE